MTFWMVFAIAGFGLLMFLGGIIVMYLVQKAVPHKVVQMPMQRKEKAPGHGAPVSGSVYTDAGEQIQRDLDGPRPHSYTGDGVTKDSAASEDAIEAVEQKFETSTRKTARDVARF